MIQDEMVYAGLNMVQWDALEKYGEMLFHENIARVAVIKQSLERNEPSAWMFQNVELQLERTTLSGICDTERCYVLRTTKAIPTTIRTKDGLPFDFVGSDEGDVFSYTTLADYKLKQEEKYTSREIYYTLMDGYIYVFGTQLLDRIYIRAIFEQPDKLYEFFGCNNCQASDNYPLNIDQLGTILDIVKARILGIQKQ